MFGKEQTGECERGYPYTYNMIDTQDAKLHYNEAYSKRQPSRKISPTFVNLLKPTGYSMHQQV